MSAQAETQGPGGSSTLFDETGGRHEGYRLKAFELLNWGSFDGKIYRLEPGGESCLLTGANGSGKTTLVDALVTLLVPPGRRHYNQSSGADLRRERTEPTYVLGAYGNLREDEGARPSAQYLRERDTYSVLVGVFHNAGYGSTVTLGQVRWFTGGNLQRVYFVLHKEAVIADLQPFDKAGEWKARLKGSLKGRVFESFEQYSQAFSRDFGFRSEKALALFSQTVGVKVLGDLNEFIRTQMLEEHDFEERFGALEQSYESLLSSHREIEKARDQLTLLEPVLEHGKAFAEHGAEHARLADLAAAHPALFARETRRFLTGRLEALAEELEQNRLALGRMDAELERLSEERDGLNKARAADSTAMRLQQIDQEVRHLEERKGERRAGWDKYADLAGQLELGVRSEAEFRENRERIAAERAAGRGKVAAALERIVALRKEIDSSQAALEELEAEIRSLRTRTSNIPRRNLEIRGLVASGLGIPEGELPFAGELIRVKPEEADWERALERLLHSFALCVLVPEDHYRRVNAFVRDHDLRGRLVYFQVASRVGRLPERQPDADSAVAKLEVKPGTAVTEWLEDHLRSAFDYRCTDDLEVFGRLARGLTRSGLIKSERRHEKDDRPPRDGHGDYVLGWDNLEKLKLLAAQAREAQAQVGDAGERLAAADREREQAQARQNAADRLLEYREYAEIDWQACVARVDELRSERRGLVAASSALKALEERIARVDSTLKAVRDDRDQLVGQARSLSEAIERDHKSLADSETLLQAFAHVDIDSFAPALAAYMGRAFPLSSREEIESLRERTRGRIEHDLEGVGERKADAQRRLELAMKGFCQPSAEIIEKYPGWSSDVLDLRVDASYLAEYERIHERVHKEDLPRYRRRFRQYLNDRMLEELVDFNQSLIASYKEIEAGIAELNASLAQILYNRNPPTFIEMQTRAATDVGVRDFREKLRGAIGDAGRLAQQDEAELEHAFARMQELILALRGDEAWRRKVLDVRNWLQFSAMEKHRADGSQKQYYQDSRSLSGGEKAKLAYTILASAIAFQFGIRGVDSRPKSFRFVMVDEAFSKVDPENAAYAMELFRTLELQLMVVTPLDKINVVEDYVRAVHYVENRDHKRSAVYNMTLEVYRKNKEEYMKAAGRVEEPVR